MSGLRSWPRMRTWQVHPTLLLVLSTSLMGAPASLQAEAGEAADTSQSREAEARSAVDSALAELLAVLANAGLSSDQRLASIEKVVREQFDMAIVARWALGKHKRRFSDSQSASYLCEVEPYVSNYIGSRFGRYQQEKVEILTAERSKSHVIVHTRIVGGEYDQALVDFRMRESEGRWLAVDVKFEGISVVENLRAQFREVVSAGGPEGLVRILAEKNGSRSDC